MSRITLPMGLYPIDSVTVYNGGYVVVNRKFAGKDVPCQGIRNKITKLTGRSTKRMVWRMMKADVNWRTMTMLSYGDSWPTDGKQVKTHLGGILNWMRYEAMNDPQIVTRETFYYLWFLEFQERKAPHIHLITNLDREYAGFDYFSYRAARKWADIVVPIGHNGWSLAENGRRWASDWGKVFRFHSHHKNWQAIRARDGAIRYACKYASKKEQKDVPVEYKDVGRFWGMSRCPEKPNETLKMTEDELREWLTAIGHPAEDWDIIPTNLYNMGT